MRAAGRFFWIVLIIASGCSSAPSTPSTAKPNGAPAATASRAVPADWPPLPSHESPYLNVGSDAHYVGSAACTRCHVEATETYHHTAMSVSMLPVDVAAEPPDGTFEHPLSGRRYEVLRRDGALWHIESKLTKREPIVLAEYAAKYVVGSGRHSRTYLVEAEGFLVESPITWYSERKQWAMSPGYDRAEHLGFERATGQGCLECHAGRTAPIGKSLHRMDVFESAIGCERCHGPGSLHVEKHRAADIVKTAQSAVGSDLTIVNPAALSRDLAEAICQQCHLRSNASIVARRHRLSDFRPGLPLTQFRHDFRLELPETPLTVVSHVEQMHLSRCYQGSDTMSCRTCHNPHAEKGMERSSLHFNTVCKTCHADRPCTATRAERDRSTPAENCIQCHMPRGDTEIPHLAFTHHRISRHALSEVKAKDPDKLPPGLGTLRPFADLTGWSQVDRERSLGLAYLELGNRSEVTEQADAYHRRAWALLIELRNAGFEDAVVNASLAQLAFKLDPARAEGFATAALANEQLSAQDRCNVLFLLGDGAIRRQPAEALPFAIELTTLRRHPFDWLMRAQAEKAMGLDPVPALETAVRINPRLVHIHQFLADHYEKTGDRESAARHRQLTMP